MKRSMHLLVLISVCLGLSGCLEEGGRITLYSYTCYEGGRVDSRRSFYAVYPQAQVVVNLVLLTPLGTVSKLKNCAIYDTNNWRCHAGEEPDDYRVSAINGKWSSFAIDQWQEYRRYKSVTAPMSALEYWLGRIIGNSDKEKGCKELLEGAKKDPREESKEYLHRELESSKRKAPSTFPP